jgi:hypothetical protein
MMEMYGNNFIFVCGLENIGLFADVSFVLCARSAG